MTRTMGARQDFVDRFYKKYGPCCAGCDFWRHYNSVAGECILSAPVSGDERVAMLGIIDPSLTPGAGHVITLRDHWCGDFVDSDREQTP